MPYIDRYRDKHLSYYSELYDCKTVHGIHIDKLMMKLEAHYLSVDRLYYHLVANNRLCCLDVLLDEQKYPSTFCIVRIYKYNYDTGKYIDEKLPMELRAMVFNRMAERLILIRDIRKHITRYRPQLWSVYCMNSPWDKIKEYIYDVDLRTALENIRRLTSNAVASSHYKYDDIADTMIKYEGFKLLYSQFKVHVSTLDKKTTPNSSVMNAIYGVNVKNLPDSTKDYVGEYLTPILMTVIFYYYSMKWAPYYSVDSLSNIVEKCLLDCLSSEGENQPKD